MALFGMVSTAAALNQPNGDPIPTQPGCNGGNPTGLAATFACACDQPGVCNIGAPCASPSSCDDGQNATCETTLWHTFNDNTCIPSNYNGLDVYTAAAVTPETFKPTCPQTFTVLTRGTAMFQDVFGWYNATGSEPQVADLHVMLGCNTTDGDQVVLDLNAEPDYLGGDVGFFIITPESHSSPGSCTNGDCCASVARLQNGEGYIYYSERQYNPDFVGQDSLIHLLIYQSQVWPNAFYFAWEDIYGGSNNDFTDLVTRVSGIHCSGGGLPCDTGQDGVCGRGITLCGQGALTCSPIFGTASETCNGVDDDCNGVVDDLASCPEAGDICHQGSCVPPCNSGEHPCIGGTLCDFDSGLCVDIGCVGVSCAAGEVCRAGDCVAPCDAVVCPHGQHCVADKCVDLCADVTCGSGEICVEGKCMPGCNHCDGLTCELPLTCDVSTGNCQDPSCASGCPAGTYCSNGQCVDACTGAVCPADQVCVNGACVDPSTAGDGGVGNDGGVGSDASIPDTIHADPGCACQGRPTTGSALPWMLLIAGLFIWIRRRRATHGGVG